MSSTYLSLLIFLSARVHHLLYDVIGETLLSVLRVVERKRHSDEREREGERERFLTGRYGMKLKFLEQLL